MFEPKLAAEREMSFGRDGFDASKACHISGEGSVRRRAAGSERRTKRGRVEKVPGMLADQISEAPSPPSERFRSLLPTQNPVAYFLRHFRREMVCPI
jgi:hypothetical protein